MSADNDFEFEEIRCLEQSLSEMEAQLNEHYCDIGKSLLELAEKEDKEINHLVDQIIETRKQISILQKQVRCPNCLSYNTPDSHFCSHCGMKLKKEETDHDRSKKS